MKYILQISLGTLALAAVVSACKGRVEHAAVQDAPKTRTICDSMKITYTADIKPILDASCAKTCHSASRHADGIDLSSYDGAKTAAEHSSFLGAVKHEAAYAPMPAKAPKLADSAIQKLSCWVKNGLQR